MGQDYDAVVAKSQQFCVDRPPMRWIFCTQCPSQPAIKRSTSCSVMPTV